MGFIFGRKEKASIRQENIESMAAYPDLPFSFSSCPVIHYPNSENVMYMIGEDNQAEAEKAILGLNELLIEAREKYAWFVRAVIERKHIRFYPSDLRGLSGDDYSRFELNPRTKTGRLTKYPLSIQIRTLSNDDDWAASKTKRIVRVHGKIDYLASGEIGRVVLYCWKGDNLFTLKWDEKNGMQCTLTEH